MSGTRLAWQSEKKRQGLQMLGPKEAFFLVILRIEQVIRQFLKPMEFIKITRRVTPSDDEVTCTRT